MSILVLPFSNKAANELSERLAARKARAIAAMGCRSSLGASARVTFLCRKRRALARGVPASSSVASFRPARSP
ncbi:hypothetical protein [Caballeronia hypogeia]|uniref:hypothetical protein n=1 Tax=Caballeronia hypogeia TaxID=1777140 RepID=UPI001E3A860A|nr:hypothetical protein [Caballeronia hypogeia]